MSATQAPDDFGQHVFEVFMALYIYPEIRRRQAAGLLAVPATIWIAQILFRPGKSLAVDVGTSILAIRLRRAQ